MRKILFGVIITLVILFSFKYCGDKREEQIILKESTALIQEQLKNVSKLVVTEGNFTEVFNYENSKEIFGDYLTADKKALRFRYNDNLFGHSDLQQSSRYNHRNQHKDFYSQREVSKNPYSRQST